MTLDEFIAAITCEHVDKLVEEQAMAFIAAADIETLGSALGMKGLTARFKDAIQNALVAKVPEAQTEAALARISTEVVKRNRLR